MSHPTNLNSSSAQLQPPQSNTSMETSQLNSNRKVYERNMNSFIQTPINSPQYKQVFSFILIIFIAIQIVSIFYAVKIHDQNQSLSDSIKSLQQDNKENQDNFNSLKQTSTKDSSILSQLIPQIEKQENKIEEISGKVKEGSTIQEQLKSQAEQIQKMSLNINTLQAITPLIQKHADEVEDLKVKVSARGDSKDVEDLKIHVAVLEQVVRSMKDQSEEVSKIKTDIAVLSTRFGQLDSSKISEDMINLKSSMRENQIVLDSYKSQFSDIKVNSDSIESIKSSLTIVQSNLAQAQQTITSVIPTLATTTQVKNYVVNLQNQITNLDKYVASISSTSSSGSGSSSGSTNTTGSSDTNTSSDPTNTSTGTTDQTDTSTTDTSSSDSTGSSGTNSSSNTSTATTTTTPTTTTSTTTSAATSTSTSRQIQLLGPYTTKSQEITMTIFNSYFSQIDTKEQIKIDAPSKSIVTLTVTGYGHCSSCWAQLSFLKDRVVSLPRTDKPTEYYGIFLLREIWQSISFTQEFQVEKGQSEFYLGLQAFPDNNRYIAFINSLSITVKVTPIV